MKLEELLSAEIEALENEQVPGQNEAMHRIPPRASASLPRELEFRKEEFAGRWDLRAQRRDARNRRAMMR